MSIVKVNRTGNKHNVYLSNACNPNEIIGTLYNNEVFTWTGEWPGSSASGYYVQSIAFRKSDGTQGAGWVAGKQSEGIFATNICSLPAKTVTYNGKTCYAFKMRRNETIYSRKSTASNKIKVGTAYKDRYILAESSTAGNTFPGWLSIVAQETGVGTNKYNAVSSDGNAFVDMDYAHGSMFNSNFALIGSL